jgi:hypothetical protein
VSVSSPCRLLNLFVGSAGMPPQDCNSASSVLGTVSQAKHAHCHGFPRNQSHTHALRTSAHTFPCPPHPPTLPPPPTHTTQLAYVSSPRGHSLSTHNPLQAPPPRRRVQRKRTREKIERGSFHTPRVREWNGRGQICNRVGAAVQREFATNVQTDRAKRKAVCEGGREFASDTRVVGESGEGVAHPSHCRRGASQSDASRRWPR